MFKQNILFQTVVIFFFAPLLSVFAFTAVTEQIAIPYEIVTINDPETEKLILGELSEAPEMFEIVADGPFSFAVEIRALPGSHVSGFAEPQFSGIIIKQKETRGVAEVARLKATDSEWSEARDKTTGLAYLAGPSYSEQFEPGTYRIEISTPENIGKYMLMFGSKSDEAGYFKTLDSIKAVYAFYGLGTLAMFSSPYIHYPIGIFVLIILIAGTWFWQRQTKKYA